MERLVKKLECEGYNANKELALTLYSIVGNSRRRKDWLLIGFPTLLLFLSATQGLKPGIAALLMSLTLGGLWTVTVMLQMRETRLQRRLTAVISETQYVTKVYIDGVVLYAVTGSLFIAAILQIWGL